MDPDNLPSEILAAQDYIAQAEFEGLKDYVLRALTNLHHSPQADAIQITLQIEKIEEMGFAGDAEAAEALLEIAHRATDAFRRLARIIDYPTVELPPSSPVAEDHQETIEEGLSRLAKKIGALTTLELSNAYKIVSTRITPTSLGRDDTSMPISPMLFPYSRKLTRNEFHAAEIIALMIQRKIAVTRQLQLSELAENRISWPSLEFVSPTQRMRWQAEFPTPSNFGKNSGLNAAEGRRPPLSKIERSSLVDWVFNVLYNRVQTFPWERIGQFEQRQCTSAERSVDSYIFAVSRNDRQPRPHGYSHDLRLRWKGKASRLPTLSADTGILSQWTDAALAFLESVADGDLDNIEWPAFILNRRPEGSKSVAGTLREVFKDGFKRRAVDK